MKASYFKRIVGIMYSLAAAMTLAGFGGLILFEELTGALIYFSLSILFALNGFFKTVEFLRWRKLQQKGMVLKF